MEFAIFLLVFLSIFGFVKWYVIIGINQAFSNSTLKLLLKINSVFSFLIGLPVMIFSFGQGLINISPWQNIVIAYMCSVFLCELLLVVVFAFDDVLERLKRLFWLGGRRSLDKSRRSFIKKLGLGAATLPFASFIYGITKGKYDFRVIRKTLVFKDLPTAFDGFKIVQFSDMHSGSFDSMEKVKEGIQMIQDENADLILFTGDLVNDLEQEIVPYKKYLKELKAPFGKYSVLGNHDYPLDEERFASKEEGLKNHEAIKQHHADMDFRLLNNSNAKIEKDKDFVRLIGVENWGDGFIKEGDLDEAIQGCAKDEFSILMSHDPTHWEKKVLTHNKHIHLTLSGHTHGSQMGIEMMGIKWSPVQYFYKRWAGLYKELEQYLYVNRGFGWVGFAGRVGIPPEITSFTLRKA